MVASGYPGMHTQVPLLPAMHGRNWRPSSHFLVVVLAAWGANLKKNRGRKPAREKRPAAGVLGSRVTVRKTQIRVSAYSWVLRRTITSSRNGKVCTRVKGREPQLSMHTVRREKSCDKHAFEEHEALIPRHSFHFQSPRPAAAVNCWAAIMIAESWWQEFLARIPQCPVRRPGVDLPSNPGRPSMHLRVTPGTQSTLPFLN